NRSTSSGVGGKPVRSNVNRRMRTRRSASGACRNPTPSSPARMNRSMGFRDQPASPTSGTSGRPGGRKAQWPRCSREKVSGGATGAAVGAGSGAESRSGSDEAATNVVPIRKRTEEAIRGKNGSMRGVPGGFGFGGRCGLRPTIVAENGAGDNGKPADDPGVAAGPVDTPPPCPGSAVDVDRPRHSQGGFAADGPS